MKTKRNLMVAVVAAMLAVPALSTVNASADNGFDTWTKAIESNHVPTKNLWQQHGDPNGEATYKGIHYIYNQGWNYVIVNGKKIPLDQAAHMIDTGAGAGSSSQSTTQSSQSSANQSSSNGSEYQNSDTNNGKLVQTGEHSTARKMGITAVIVALIAFVIFKVRKVAKRN